MPDAPKYPPPPSFNSGEFQNMFLQRRHDELAEQFLAIIRHFERVTYATFDPRYLNEFVKQFLYIFTQPEFQPNAKYIYPFVRFNWVISNLVAISSFKTTDAYLEVLKHQEGNFFKILTLWSPRNTVTFDRTALFDADPALASTWYCVYGQNYRAGMVSRTVCDNFREHFAFSHPKMSLTWEPQDIFFGSTYVDGLADRALKPWVNKSLREMLAKTQPPIKNTPNPKKIAVMSAVWSVGHSVYRNYYEYIKAIEGYHLTFVRFGKKYNHDLSHFDEVLDVDFVNGVLDISAIKENDFGIVYFPDIGLSPHSVFLSNMRIAPIQCCSPGHSVSTWGSDIDYYISGVDVEPPDRPERNYSERLVLIPGCGVVHNVLPYQLTGRKKTVPEFVINCPWTPHKINYRFCTIVREIIDRAEKKLRLRIFAGGALNKCNDQLPFVRDLMMHLGTEGIEVVRGLGGNDYLALMEEGDLSIDSFHFGGCNTVADSLHLRQPTVSWAGDRWYNRIGAQMLRMAGLPELAVTNERDYVELVLKLINNDTYFAEIQEKVRTADLDNSIFSTADAKYFEKALDYLSANHERLKNDPERSAIYIER